MTKLLMFVASAAGGYIGWWLGESIGLWTAFMLSSVFTIVGICTGYWLGRRLEDG